MNPHNYAREMRAFRPSAVMAARVLRDPYTAQELALSRKIGLEPKIVRRELRAMKREEAAKAKRGAA